MKILRKLSLVFAALSLTPAQAFEFTFGGQVGMLGLAEGNSDTDLGYGAFVQASALDILSLQLDYLRSDINGATVQGFAPNLVWNIVKFDELRFGLLAGPGFYEVASDPWRFGLTGGVFTDFTFIPHIPIGLQARYHSIFSGSNNDLWSVFMTIGFRFDMAGGDSW